jgi:hypothetical protein
MLQILETASARSPGVGATVALFVVWLAAWVLVFATALAMPRPAPQGRVDWLGSPFAGMRSDMLPEEALAACRTYGGTASAHRRSWAETEIPTVLCKNVQLSLHDVAFSQVEFWYCGEQVCIVELVSFDDTGLNRIGDRLESNLGRPQMVPGKPRCAEHDPPGCERRYDSARTWNESGGGVRLRHTQNDQPGDAPLYLSFAYGDGMTLWR